MKVLDVALRVIGGVLAVVLAVSSALLETLAASLWIGEMRAPWSIIGAGVGNAFLIWFAWTVVGRRWAMWLPVGAWTSLMLLLAVGTDEGDIGIPNTWVGIGTVFAGLFSFAVLMFMYAGRPMPGEKRPARPVAPSVVGLRDSGDSVTAG